MIVANNGHATSTTLPSSSDASLVKPVQLNYQTLPGMGSGLSANPGFGVPPSTAPSAEDVGL